MGAFFRFRDFIAALFFIARVRASTSALDLPNDASPNRPHLLADLAEGVHFAWAPPADRHLPRRIVAMAFAFVALFPAMAAADGRTESVGWLLSAMAVGALVIGLFSGWTGKVGRHGRAVVIAAAIWALGIVALGFAPSLMLGLVCLAVAGAADMVSGVFRGTIWNETIPNTLRGRLAGIEMISYLTGPPSATCAPASWPMPGGCRPRSGSAAWVSGGVIATGFAFPASGPAGAASAAARTSTPNGTQSSCAQVQFRLTRLVATPWLYHDFHGESHRANLAQSAFGDLTIG